MTTIESLLQRNKATEHVPLPYISELSTLGAPPIRTLIVPVLVTCADPRVCPEKWFNLNPGEVIIHRNVGGNVQHAFRDISVLDALFTIDEIAIIHHTDCGTTHFKEEQVREYVKTHTDEAHSSEVDKMVFGANADIEKSVKEDLAWVRTHPMIREQLKGGCQGFVFDIKTGELKKVGAA
ncbi:carbonic anhydrase [Dactylonectria estremocensis]|uniref:Carbonic anhydrase n=1 Tax=Dactylonectria estremocensis TaxID=1079267 RepID=A0A9P9EFI4_9HYPO|nr:carbonic anhydrase [Dactylonectria estremocensis]